MDLTSDKEEGDNLVRAVLPAVVSGAGSTSGADTYLFSKIMSECMMKVGR